MTWNQKFHKSEISLDTGLQDLTLLNYTRVENAHKVGLREKTSNFLSCIEDQLTFVFHFPRWDIIKCLNASMLKTAVFELVQHATEIGSIVNAISTCRDGFRERGALGHLSFGGPKHMWPIWPFVWKAWKYAPPMCGAHLKNLSFVLASLVLH